MIRLRHSRGRAELLLPSGRRLEIIPAQVDAHARLQDAAGLVRETYREYEAAPHGTRERALAWLRYQGAVSCEGYWLQRAMEASRP